MTPDLIFLGASGSHADTSVPPNNSNKQTNKQTKQIGESRERTCIDSLALLHICFVSAITELEKVN